MSKMSKYGKILELNKRYVESLSAIELDGIMKEFDVYEIQKQDFGLTVVKFHKYLSPVKNSW